MNPERTYLINEPALLVLPTLAERLGINSAVVIQQIHYWLVLNAKAKKESTHFFEGKWWCYNSYKNWREDNFRWWSERTIQRIFNGLSQRGLIECRETSDGNFQGNWVTINYDALDKIMLSETNIVSPDSDKSSTPRQPVVGNPPPPRQPVVAPTTKTDDLQILPDTSLQKDSHAPTPRDDEDDNSGEEAPSPSLEATPEVPKRKEGQKSYTEMFASGKVSNKQESIEDLPYAELEKIILDLSPPGTLTLTNPQRKDMRRPGCIQTKKMAQPIDCPSPIEMYESKGWYWRYINESVVPRLNKRRKDHNVARGIIIEHYIRNFDYFWDWREKTQKEQPFADNFQPKVEKRQITSEDLGIPKDYKPSNAFNEAMNFNPMDYQVKE